MNADPAIRLEDATNFLRFSQNLINDVVQRLKQGEINEQRAQALLPGIFSKIVERGIDIQNGRVNDKESILIYDKSSSMSNDDFQIEESKEESEVE